MHTPIRYVQLKTGFSPRILCQTTPSVRRFYTGRTKMRDRRNYYHRILAVLISCFIAAQTTFAAQLETSEGLHIAIVQGDRAQNVLEQIPPDPITVMVTDSNNQPV